MTTTLAREQYDWLSQFMLLESTGIRGEIRMHTFGLFSKDVVKTFLGIDGNLRLWYNMYFLYVLSCYFMCDQER